jgi:radical SAM protein with 4Fe4S-binding SPASM domain
MISKKVQLSSVVFEITQSCNLHCMYCYNYWKKENTEAKNTKETSFRENKQLLKKLLKDAHIEQISFSGGEPFLAERLEETVLFLRLKGIGVNIITNGNTASKEAYRRLNNLGINHFILPLHSALASEHNEMSGNTDAHKKSVESIKYLLEIQANVVPVIVITKINSESIEDTIRFIHQMGIKRIMLNRYNIGGEGIAKQKSILCENKDLQSCFAIANHLSSQLKLDISSNVCTPHCVLNPRNYPNISFSHCSDKAERRPLTIDNQGNIRFCNHSPEIMGNIFRENISTIIHNNSISWFKDIPSFCKDCEKYPICLGGCRAASLQYYGDYKKVDPIVVF